jgi:hypothetical protein
MVFEVAEGIVAENAAALAAKGLLKDLYQFDVAGAYALIESYLTIERGVDEILLALGEQMRGDIFFGIFVHGDAPPCVVYIIAYNRKNVKGGEY